MSLYRVAPASGFVVRVKGDDRGMGKVIRRAGSQVTVEYFHSIAFQEQTVVAAGEVQRVYLNKQTRCYLFNEDQQRWVMGRIGERDKLEYEVNLPEQQSIWVSEASIYVRSSMVVDDATETLVHKGHETALFHDHRHRLIGELTYQRAASRGMSALVAARVDLFPHQVEAVRRVLEDPIQRYLLADEVGLGKTIEAGILIRQYLLDDRTGHVLVVVPPLLASQWRHELETRCQVLPDDRVELASSSDLVKYGKVAALGMFVVDEAQHVAKGAESSDPTAVQQYRVCARLARVAERVLLLSATPAATNEMQFLAMLHLLDPDTYRLEGAREFRDRVRLRQDIGRVLLTLGEKARSFALKLSLDRLRVLFPGDNRIAEYSRELLAVLEAPSSSAGIRERLVRSIRTHVSETYRLHQRMVRSRRSESTEAILARTLHSVQAYHDTSAPSEQVDGLLDEWRELASAAVRHEPEGTAARVELQDVFLELAQAADGSPQRFLELIRSRLERVGEGTGQDNPGGLAGSTAGSLASTHSFAGENEVLRALSNAAIEQSRHNQRLEALVALLVRIREKAGVRVVPKCVVFAAASSTAVCIAERLADAMGRRYVAQHTAVQDEASVEAEVRRFETDRDCFVLLCDETGEEGRNFQFAEHLVLYDLPWNPNRLEQRIGRVDRVGRTRNLAIHVMLGPSSDSSMHFGWYRFLTDGLGLFRNSVAALQFYLDSIRPAVLAAAFDRGAKGFLDRIPSTRSDVEAEYERIAEQDAIDAVDTRSDATVELQRALDLADRRCGEFKMAVDGWLCEILQFERDGDAHRSEVVRYREDKHTLVPADELRSRFGHQLNRWGTYDRAFASRYPEVALHRPGEGLIDALAGYAEWDDRGRAFAIWREDRNWDPREGAEWIGFRFDLIVEADASLAKQVLTQRGERGLASKATDRRADGLYPPRTETVFVNADLEEVTDTRVLSLLQQRFAKRQTQHGVDYNLTKERLQAIDEVVPVDKWDQLCGQAREAALRIVKARASFRESCEVCASRASRMMQLKLEQLHLRSERLGFSEVAAREEDLEREVFSAIVDGIRNPRIRVDSAGFIVVSGRAPRPGIAATPSEQADA